MTRDCHCSAYKRVVIMLYYRYYAQVYSQIVMHVRHVRTVFERGPVRHFRLVRSALRAEYRAEVAVG